MLFFLSKSSLVVQLSHFHKVLSHKCFPRIHYWHVYVKEPATVDRRPSTENRTNDSDYWGLVALLCRRWLFSGKASRIFREKDWQVEVQNISDTNNIKNSCLLMGLKLQLEETVSMGITQWILRSNNTLQNNFHPGMIPCVWQATKIQSATVVSARWATVDWSWHKEWNQ